MTEPAKTIGVVGAGTMGAGIAQLATQSGARTLLHDPIEAALEKGMTSIRAALERLAERGRIEPASAEEALARLQPAPALSDLAECELVIEAAPERLELKQRLFGELEEIVSGSCVLATNSSSIPVAAVAGACSRPQRVVGMHFFNPAPVMRLLEVIAGPDSAPEALELARATGEAMGRRVIDAADGPGFLVNRCNRPFGLEALRLVTERIADHEQVDRICRIGGGFRMGPFELMDLVGIDVGLEVSRSFYEQSFGEPRWRPSPLTARMAAAGRLGRKSGRGFYSYTDGPHRPDDPEPPVAGGGDRRTVEILGSGAVADDLRAASAAADFAVLDAPENPASPPQGPASSERPWLTVDCAARPPVSVGGRDTPADIYAPRAIFCARGSLKELDRGSLSGGFYLLPNTSLVELTRSATSSERVTERMFEFFSSLGRIAEWVGDAPGLVLGRIVCQLANEAAFALGEGVGSEQDIDVGMRMGLNHPVGPLERARVLGLDHVRDVVGALCDEYREERYRPAPTLRRLSSSAEPVD